MSSRCDASPCPTTDVVVTTPLVETVTPMRSRVRRRRTRKPKRCKSVGAERARDRVHKQSTKGTRAYLQDGASLSCENARLSGNPLVLPLPPTFVTDIGDTFGGSTIDVSATTDTAATPAATHPEIPTGPTACRSCTVTPERARVVDKAVLLWQGLPASPITKPAASAPCSPLGSHKSGSQEQLVQLHQRYGKSQEQLLDALSDDSSGSRTHSVTSPGACERLSAMIDAVQDQRTRDRQLAAAKRAHPVRELCATEARVAAQLRDACALASALTAANVLSEQEVCVLLGNVAELAPLHDALARQLEAAVEAAGSEGEAMALVGPLVAHQAMACLPVYLKYVLNMHAQERMLSALRSTAVSSDDAPCIVAPALAPVTVSRVHAWLKQAHADQGQTVGSCPSLSTKLAALGSLAVLPFQRITKYPLLMREIAKHTPAGHQDHAACLEAQARMAATCARINEAHFEQQSRREWLEMYAALCAYDRERLADDCAAGDRRIIKVAKFIDVTHAVQPAAGWTARGSRDAAAAAAATVSGSEHAMFQVRHDGVARVQDGVDTSESTTLTAGGYDDTDTSISESLDTSYAQDDDESLVVLCNDMLYFVCPLDDDDDNDDDNNECDDVPGETFANSLAITMEVELHKVFIVDGESMPENEMWLLSQAFGGLKKLRKVPKRAGDWAGAGDWRSKASGDKSLWWAIQQHIATNDVARSERELLRVCRRHNGDFRVEADAAAWNTAERMSQEEFEVQARAIKEEKQRLLQLVNCVAMHPEAMDALDATGEELVQARRVAARMTERMTQQQQPSEATGTTSKRGSRRRSSASQQRDQGSEAPTTGIRGFLSARKAARRIRRKEASAMKARTTIRSDKHRSRRPTGEQRKRLQF